MLTATIKIGDGPEVDSLAFYGLIYLGGDKRTSAPVKEMQVSAYVGEPGEHIDRRTVPASFTHTTRFLINCPNNNARNANTIVNTLNEAMYDIDENGIRHFKEMTIHDHYQRIKITGIPEPVAEPEKLHRRADGSVEDCMVVNLKIKVEDPGKCDFATFPVKDNEIIKGDSLSFGFYRADTNGQVVLNQGVDYMRSLRIRLYQGSSYRLSSHSHGSAPAMIRTFDNSNEIWTNDNSLDSNLDKEWTSSGPGWLYCNCHKDFRYSFCLMVNNTKITEPDSTET